MRLISFIGIVPLWLILFCHGMEHNTQLKDFGCPQSHAHNRLKRRCRIDPGKKKTIQSLEGTVYYCIISENGELSFALSHQDAIDGKIDLYPSAFHPIKNARKKY